MTPDPHPNSKMPQPTHTEYPQVRLAADLIPNLVDKRAALTPHNVYAEYPNSPLTYDLGYRSFRFTDLANAVNGIAWWLHRTLGPSHTFETLAYIGPNDIRYPAIILGAVKAGYAVRGPTLPWTRPLWTGELRLLDLLDLATEQPCRPFIFIQQLVL